LANENVPSPTVVAFCPASDTAAPPMAAPVCASRTRPDTVSRLSRVSTAVTFDSAEGAGEHRRKRRGQQGKTSRRFEGINGVRFHKSSRLSLEVRGLERRGER